MIKKSIFFIFVILFSTQNVFAICKCPANALDCEQWCNTHCLIDGSGNHYNCSSDLEPLGGDSYTIYYQCPSGGTTPASTTTNPFTGSYTLKTVSSACTKTGYTGSDWACYKYGTNTSAPLSSSGTYPYTYNVTCKSTSWVANKYTLKYTCGAGTGNETSNEMTYGTTTYALRKVSGYCTNTNGYFDGWSCKKANGEDVYLSQTNTKWDIASDVTCTAQWRSKSTKNLKWDDRVGSTTYSPNSCTIGEQIGTLPVPPRRPGYKFTGWKVDKTCGLLTKYNGSQPTGYCSYDFNGKCAYDSETECEQYPWNELYPGDTRVWKDNVFEADVRALCSSTPGTQYKTGEPKENEYGKYCWCKIIKFKLVDNSTMCEFASSSSWVYLESITPCEETCARRCGNVSRNNVNAWNAFYNAVQK